MYLPAKPSATHRLPLLTGRLVTLHCQHPWQAVTTVSYAVIPWQTPWETEALAQRELHQPLELGAYSKVSNNYLRYLN